ncbi:hypothetical protein D3C73_1107540 [compost metagenome]
MVIGDHGKGFTVAEGIEILVAFVIELAQQDVQFGQSAAEHQAAARAGRGSGSGRRRGGGLPDDPMHYRQGDGHDAIGSACVHIHVTGGQAADMQHRVFLAALIGDGVDRRLVHMHIACIGRACRTFSEGESYAAQADCCGAAVGIDAHMEVVVGTGLMVLCHGDEVAARRQQRKLIEAATGGHGVEGTVIGTAEHAILAGPGQADADAVQARAVRGDVIRGAAGVVP